MFVFRNAGCNAGDNHNMQEAFVKHVVSHVMDTCGTDLAFFNQFYDKELLERLQRIKDKPFVRVSGGGGGEASPERCSWYCSTWCGNPLLFSFVPVTSCC